MNDSQILDIMKKVGAIIKDSHIVYTSGRHGSAYVNKDAVYPYTNEISKLCKEMAFHFKDKNIEVVAGPTIGGVILSQWVAYHLSVMTGNQVLAVFAEEDEHKQRFFKRGYDKIIPDKNVLIVEDIITTGGSVKKVVAAINNLKGKIVGCSAICNRGGIKASDLDLPVLDSLINLILESWEENSCPLCAKNIPINTNVGKGKRRQKTTD